MTPLIDTELEKIDRKHNSLMELNMKVVEALQMYHGLMRELPAYGYTSLPGETAMPKMAGQPQFSMPPQQQPQV